MGLATPMRPTPRQVNLLLEVLLLVALGSGLTSWAIGTSWARVATAVHAVAGLAILVVAPWKIGGSVRTGFRRGRATRWLSAAFGGLVLATVALGILHATGLWYGVGYWSAPIDASHLGDNEAPVGPEFAEYVASGRYHHRGFTIAGGSSEVQHNIIAKQVLGL